PSLAARVAGSPWASVPAGTGPVDLVLAGRGVLRTGAVPALNRFAERTGIGVLNAFTSKGVFRWDSPYHIGTGFLQYRDLALAAGRPDPVLITVGLDADECPPEVFAAAGVDPASTWRIEPDELAGLSAGAGAPRARVNVTESGRSPLYRDLSAMMGPLYAADDVPPNPARVSADLAAGLPANGRVWAEPGRAGLW
ncbi:thiamine pyrophosphate-binding protein, partial [Frankia sp. AgKG'84/4]|nr:thiamine pyrophosphate-binding protein [Frankia sp. AgKG'84/4]